MQIACISFDLYRRFKRACAAFSSSSSSARTATTPVKTTERDKREEKAHSHPCRTSDAAVGPCSAILERFSVLIQLHRSLLRARGAIENAPGGVLFSLFYQVLRSIQKPLRFTLRLHSLRLYEALSVSAIHQPAVY